MKRYWHLIVLSVITLFAFALRMYRLDWQCLKVDELVTMQAAQMSALDIMTWALSVDYNPPMYYLLAHFSTLLFGVSSFAIRFPAVICGALCIPVIYMVGKEVKGKTLGLVMAAVSSFAFPFFYYSQDARAYPLVMLGFMLFTYFWLRVYNGDRDAVIVFALGASAALCFWSHYFAAVPIVVMMAALARTNLTTVAISSIWCGIFMLPAIVMFDITQFSTRTNHGVFNVLWLSPAKIALTVTNEMLCWMWVILIPLAAYCLWRYNNPTLDVFTAASLATPVVLILVANFIATMPRYAILVAPLIICIAMYPVASYIDESKDWAKKIATFLGVIFLLFLLNYGSIISWTTFSICPMMLAEGYFAA